MQLTLITYRDFLHHVDKTDFCCFPNDENCKEDKLKYQNLPLGKTRPPTALSIDVVSPTLQPPQDIRRNMTQSGMVCCHRSDQPLGSQFKIEATTK